jgi:peroxiredoxin
VDGVSEVTHTLHQYRGKKVWLAFFRYAACPLCNLRVHQIKKRYAAQIEAGSLVVLAVFQSPVASIKETVGTQVPPFPLLSDASEATYDLYQAKTSRCGFVMGLLRGNWITALRLGFLGWPRPEGQATRLPADFLIGEDGKFADVFYAQSMDQHIPFPRVEAFLGLNSKPAEGAQI